MTKVLTSKTRFALASLVFLIISLACTTFPAPEFKGINGWVNSEPLTMEELHGKVVLIDFWTYTCVNCIRTLPYLKDWYAKYSDQGLVILGVHSPEFEFEKSINNVHEAVS